MADTTHASDDSRDGPSSPAPPPASSTTTTEQAGRSGGLTQEGRSFKPPILNRFFSHQPKRDRQYYESLSLSEKRKLYSCGRDFRALETIDTWEEFHKKYPHPNPGAARVPLQPSLARKVSLWRGDITCLEIGAIVNAANSSLLGGGGVDGAIHRAASRSLVEECKGLKGCDTGDAKITSGHRLPAKYVIHTVGPMDASEHLLRSCYTQCLKLVASHQIQSVAFCCIATGVYGFPNVKAAHIALETIRKWLDSDSNADKIDRIIFCVFLREDYSIYQKLLNQYFPVELPAEDDEGHSEVVTAQPELGQPEVPLGQPEVPLGQPEVPLGDDAEKVPTLRKNITEPAWPFGRSEGTTRPDLVSIPSGVGTHHHVDNTEDSHDKNSDVVTNKDKDASAIRKVNMDMEKAVEEPVAETEPSSRGQSGGEHAPSSQGIPRGEPEPSSQGQPGNEPEPPSLGQPGTEPVPLQGLSDECMETEQQDEYQETKRSKLETNTDV